jgi:hypothetical protein
VLENAGLLAAATLVMLRAEWSILFHAYTFQPDAQVHTYWMRRFQDPALFNDPLTHALLKTGYVPAGVQFVYRLASYVVDPVVFGPWLGVALGVVSAWLVFLIVREHTDWWPAAWMAAGLFLLPVDYLKFSGGHPRAFEYPIVLLTVYLLVRQRFRMAVAVPAVGALFYPPSAVGALAVMAMSCLTLRGGRPWLDRVRTAPALVCTAATAVALLLPRLFGGEQSLITEAQARALPEFGSHGQMFFFTSSILTMLKARYSGFDITATFAIVALTALLLLLLRPRNIHLLKREVLWMGVTSLLLYGIAYSVLFALYLPNRYTYPLLPFSCIAIGVAWRPTFESVGRRLQPTWLIIPVGLAATAGVAFAAVRLVPLGPELSSGAFSQLFSGPGATIAVAIAITVAAVALARRRRTAAGMVAVATVLAGTLLVAEVAIAGGGASSTATCRIDPAALHYLGTLPPDAVIAGDPTSIDCVTMVSERPVVISKKLYQVFNNDYLRIARPRMFAMTEAYFGDSRAKIVDLRRRFGADYLVVQPASFLRGRGHIPPNWSHMSPFTGIAYHLLLSPLHAALELPAQCLTWHDSQTEVYSLKCVASN